MKAGSEKRTFVGTTFERRHLGSTPSRLASRINAKEIPASCIGYEGDQKRLGSLQRSKDEKPLAGSGFQRPPNKRGSALALPLLFF